MWSLSQLGTSSLILAGATYARPGQCLTDIGNYDDCDKWGLEGNGADERS